MVVEERGFSRTIGDSEYKPGHVLIVTNIDVNDYADDDDLKSELSGLLTGLSFRDIMFTPDTMPASQRTTSTTSTCTWDSAATIVRSWYVWVSGAPS